MPACGLGFAFGSPQGNIHVAKSVLRTSRIGHVEKDGTKYRLIASAWNPVI
jgi:hypothetical protein